MSQTSGRDYWVRTLTERIRRAQPRLAARLSEPPASRGSPCRLRRCLLTACARARLALCPVAADLAEVATDTLALAEDLAMGLERLTARADTMIRDGYPDNPLGRELTDAEWDLIVVLWDALPTPARSAGEQAADLCGYLLRLLSYDHHGCRRLLALLDDLVPDELPALSPDVLAWQGGTVVRLANSITANRDFTAMPVLGDALEDAGCTDAAILEHCRGPGPHYLGCHVLEAIHAASALTDGPDPPLGRTLYRKPLTKTRGGRGERARGASEQDAPPA